MALLAGRGKIAVLSLFSGDSDFIPGIEAVKREGVLVTLWHGSNHPSIRPSMELFEVVDERRQLTTDVLTKILRLRFQEHARGSRTYLIGRRQTSDRFVDTLLAAFL